MIDGAPFKVRMERALGAECTRLLAERCACWDREWEYKFFLKDARGRDWVMHAVPVGTTKS